MNWEEFFTDHRINFVTRGPNTKRGEVSIRCPWCGDDDPSEHLGVSLDREAWGCHRSASHRGKHPLRLIQALLGCSQAQAKLVVTQYGASDPETLDQALASLDPTHAPPKAKLIHERLRLLPEFKQISPARLTQRFWDYMQRRGFDEVDGVCSAYNLQCCLIGRWKDRIIIPIYKDKRLIAWTARAIQKTIEAPRYLSTSQAIKTTIFNEDEIVTNREKAKILFVTEGPFDALKMDYYGYRAGARATCVFGTSITIDQISILKQAAKNYKKVVLLLDDDAMETSFNTLEWLPEAVMGTLPKGVEDPGDLLPIEVRNLVKASA